MPGDSQLIIVLRFFSRAQAAAYVGVSTRTFDAEIAQGMWPPPLRRGAKGGALTWDRRVLDVAADRLCGLGLAGPMGNAADLDAAAEQAALEALRRGTAIRPFVGERKRKVRAT